jgi:putative heme-binding domain-containing protein
MNRNFSSGVTIWLLAVSWVGATQTPKVDKAALQAALIAPAAPAGDPAVGKPIFEKVCATCHKFGTAGKEVGPDLSAVASRLKKPEIVEALLWPSKAIADQYTPLMIQTKDGDVVTGLLVKENARAITLLTPEAPDKPVEILKSKIQERGKSTVSSMPENLLDPYTPEQIAGLIAFLLAGPR